MPTYLVTGHDSDGAPRSEAVEASSSEEAMASVGFIATNAKQRKDLAGKRAKAGSRPAQSAHRSGGDRSNKPKVSQSQFVGLQVAAGVLRTLGAIAVLVGLWTLANALTSGQTDSSGQSIAALLPILGGALLYGFGEACLALRVIAINSFRN